MRVLLDECVPADLAKHLSGHEVTTVPRARLSSAKDALVLRSAARGFDVFLTVDRSLVYQQRIPEALALITLRVRNNRMPFILPLVSDVLAALDQIKPGDRIEIASPEQR